MHLGFRSRTALIVVSAAIAGVGVGAILGLRARSDERGAASRGAHGASIVHTATLLDRSFFDRAYDRAMPAPALARGVRGLILPHHLLAAPLIAGAVTQVSASNPTRVVLIGPDHLGRSRAPAIVSRARWVTPYGDLFPDRAAVDQLDETGLVGDGESVFNVEHSIAALVPFVRRSFPNAEIVPILVNERLAPARADALAAALPTDDRTLVIASVDFSHYLPSAVAQFHDQTARAVLATFAFDDLPELDVDSPASLRVFLRAMESRGARQAEILANTNSAELSGNTAASETTSYVIAAFSDGTSAHDDAISVLAVGDMMFDRGVRATMAEHDAEFPFARIRSGEGRFFRGVDIITGNLEGAIGPRRAPVREVDFAFDAAVAPLLRTVGFDAVTLANNHAFDQGLDGLVGTRDALARVGVGAVGDPAVDDGHPWTAVIRGRRVAMLGFHAAGRAVDTVRAMAAVRDAAAQHDIVLVHAHWGLEYAEQPTVAQRAFGRALVDAGATAVIGHHPHVVQGMEVWRGRPIFWSLGNFIFDADAPLARRGLAVGLVVSADGVSAYLFPITITNTQPALVSGRTAAAALAEFAARSDLEVTLRDAALRGTLTLVFE